MRIAAWIWIGLVAGLLPATAQEPTIWRDPVHGCAYLLPPQGGIGLRHRRDGAPDCADIPSDAAETGSVARNAPGAAQASPPAPAEAAACLLFGATCITGRPEARGPLEGAGTSLRRP